MIRFSLPATLVGRKWEIFGFECTHIEPEVDGIAVLDNVVFVFQADIARYAPWDIYELDGLMDDPLRHSLE